jgi:sugar phosphate isomerase/epimerase
MKIGIFTALFHDRSIDEALDIIAENASRLWNSAREHIPAAATWTILAASSI